MTINKLNYFPIPSMEVEFEEFRKLKTKEEKKAFREVRKAEYEKKTPAEKKAYNEASMKGLNAIKERVEELIEIVELEEVTNIISLSYLAQKYFGKTRHWLYQRLNGSFVNGKPARFTSDERKKLREALLDVSNIIKNTSLKIA